MGGYNKFSHVYKYKNVVESVARKCNIDKAEAQYIIDNTIETLVHNIILGKTVQLDNFGSFQLRFLQRRSIPNHYMSGEEAVSEAHFKIYFKEYETVKRRAAKKYREFIEEFKKTHDVENLGGSI